MHEQVILPCVFGCPHGADSLGHYLTCGILWACVQEVSRFVVSFEARDRMGLSLQVEDLFHLALAYRAYHTLRIEYPQVVTEAIGRRSFFEVQRHFIQLMRGYAPEFLRTFCYVQGRLFNTAEEDG